MLATAFALPETDCENEPVEREHTGAEPLDARLQEAPLRTIEAKEHLFRDGQAVSHVYKVEIGHVCIYKMLSDGRRQVIDFAYPGDIIGLGAIGEHVTNAQATTRTRVRCLPLSSLRRVMRDDARLGLDVYEAMARELSAARELLFTVSQCTASERVAAFLLALSRRNARNGENAHELVLPMTRTDIADFLGLTIETVSRTFTKLRCEGLIDLAHSVLVTIRDYPRLAEMARGHGQ